MKTTWQKIYSFLGFWKYYENIMQPNGDNKQYLVIYWCMFPWHYYQKINVFWWKVDEFNVYQRLEDTHRKIDHLDC